MPMKKAIRILYLEDQPEDVELVRELLSREYFPGDLTWVNGRGPFETALRDAWNYDLLLVDYSLPDIGGDEALDLAKAHAPGLPFVYLAGSLGEEKAVECLRRGATDYVLKTNLPRLAPVLRRALEEAGQAARRREAELSHARIASLLRATLESTPEGILVVDLAGRISAYNRKFLSLCGIPDFVMAPMEMDEVIQYLTNQFGDPGALLDEARLLQAHSDKESAGLLTAPGGVIQERGRPHQVGGQTVGRVLSFHEATAQEPPTDLLKGLGAGRTPFTEAALAARVVPWFLQEDRLVMPESGAAILGLDAPPPDLAALVDLLHPQDAQSFLEALERSQNVRFKARLRASSGEWRWTQWHVDRGVEGYRGVVIEIAEQERLHQRALEHERRKGNREMARHLADRYQKHFRAPLETLRILPSTDTKVDLAQEALHDADRLLGDLRAFAATENPLRVPVRLNTFLQEVLQRAARAAGPGIELRFEPGANVPDVHLAPGPLEDALQRLIENAREAMGGSGTIQVATGLEYPRPYRPGRLAGPLTTRLFIEVRDQGPGFPPAIQSRAFEPFVTTHAHPSRGGLGLAIVREVVEGHHGTVQLGGAPGKGATVRILIPL